MQSGENVLSSPADLRNELSARFHGPLMSFFLRRVRDRTEAEDLTQEVLLRVLNAADPNHIRKADSFVFKIAINLLRDRKRQSARRGFAGFVPLEVALASEL